MLLVYDGVLRFSEDDVPYEVHAGEYHIQKHNTFQRGDLPSSSPKYMFIHFTAQWSEHGQLPKRGTFDLAGLKSDLEQMHTLYHTNAPYIVKTAKFYNILLKLCQKQLPDTPSLRIADYIEKNCEKELDLTALCKQFSYSKNHLINLFKKDFGQTPIAYLNHVRLCKAQQLLIMTSTPIEQICHNSGYRNYSHFYRQFVAKNGISPERFRKKKQAGE